MSVLILTVTFLLCFFFCVSLLPPREVKKMQYGQMELSIIFWYCCFVASECNDVVNATAVLKVMVLTIIK